MDLVNATSRCSSSQLPSSAPSSSAGGGVGLWFAGDSKWQKLLAEILSPKSVSKERPQRSQQVGGIDLTDEDNDLEDLPHHKSFEQLETASAHCRLCLSFLDALSRNFNGMTLEEARALPAWSKSPIILRGIQYQDEIGDPGGIFYIKVRCDTPGLQCYVYFSPYTNVDNESDGVVVPQTMILGRQIKPPTENFGLLNRWIKQCQTEHKTCSVVKSTLPTRVIDVRPRGDDSVRLVATSPGQQAPYVTLSHCWGANPHHVIQTLTANLPDHLKRIPLHALTNTFRDAVVITRELDVQYLWIDSLCIVQDDEEDWQRESSQMASIYTNSYLTVAAAGSGDSTGGCFLQRPTTEEHVRIKCTTPDGVGSVFLRPRLRDFATLPKSPLHVRAWVAQERLLSPRTIHYDVDQMLWECREGRQAESGVPDDAFTVQSSVWDQRLHTVYPYLHHGGFQRDFYWDWYDIVSNFTTRFLTNRNDYFPALSGLADYSSKFAGKYAAGLWINHIAVGLLWRRSNDFLKPAQNYRAPSWSWASCDGAVSFPDELYVEASNNMATSTLGDDVDITVRPLGLDPRGRLGSASITITGPLIFVDARRNPADDPIPEGPSLDTMETLWLGDEMVGKAYFDAAYDPDNAGHRIACLQTLEWKAREPRFHAVLLVETGESGVFRRVGFGKAVGEMLHEAIWFKDAQRQRVTII